MSHSKRKKHHFVSLFVLLALLTALLMPAGAFSAGGTAFTVRIENVSGGSSLPGPFAPGVWAVHSGADPLFADGAADYGDGLVAVAEDGDPTALGASLAGDPSLFDSGVFNTPEGAGGPAPIFPGEAYEFTVLADPANRNLSLATMLVQSNDAFLAPDGSGIELFDAGDNPISGDVTALVELWDVGSEVNEAPGMGPNQAPRQGGPDTGAMEGGVHSFDNSTRSLPIASGIAMVTVVENSGTFSITLENISGDSGALDTPIAPLFYATHDDTWALFTPGAPEPGDGLEVLAEDGSPADLVASYMGAPGTDEVGSAGGGGIGTGGE